MMVDTCNPRNAEAGFETSLGDLSQNQIKWNSTDTEGQCIFTRCSWGIKWFNLRAC